MPGWEGIFFSENNTAQMLIVVFFLGFQPLEAQVLEPPGELCANEPAQRCPVRCKRRGADKTDSFPQPSSPFPLYFSVLRSEYERNALEWQVEPLKVTSYRPSSLGSGFGEGVESQSKSPRRTAQAPPAPSNIYLGSFRLGAGWLGLSPSNCLC